MISQQPDKDEYRKLHPRISLSWEPDMQRLEEVLTGQINPSADDPKPRGFLTVKGNVSK